MSAEVPEWLNEKFFEKVLRTSQGDKNLTVWNLFFVFAETPGVTSPNLIILDKRHQYRAVSEQRGAIRVDAVQGHGQVCQQVSERCLHEALR